VRTAAAHGEYALAVAARGHNLADGKCNPTGSADKPRGRVRGSAIRGRLLVFTRESGMSGREFSFEVNRTSSAPAATLFRLVADGANWSKWAKPIVLQSSWARQGDPAPGGVGAVRKVGMWPLLVQEETVA